MDKRIRLYWAGLDQEMRHVIVYSTVMIVAIVLFAAGARALILGGVNQLALTPTSISSQIIQDIKGQRIIDGAASLGSIDQGGHSYQVDNVAYFENQAWAVADLHPREAVNQSATVIMRKEGHEYTIAMGPGTNFPREALTALQAPSGLVNYLDERGMISTIGG